MRLSIKDATKLIAPRIIADSSLTKIIIQAERKAWKSLKWKTN